MTLGRSSSCDIQVPFRVVSAHHLTFQRAGNRYRLRDEGTTNGTRVDGERLPPGEWIVAEDGMALQVVDVVFEIAVEREAADVDAFTLGETGTLARKMLSNALEQDDDDRAFFEVAAGARRGETFRLPDDVENEYLGSSANCYVQLPGNSVAERAARLAFSNGSYQVEPTGQTTLRIGDEIVENRRQLTDGDRLRFDGCELVFNDPLQSHLMELEGLGGGGDEGTTPPEDDEPLPEDAGGSNGGGGGRDAEDRDASSGSGESGKRNSVEMESSESNSGTRPDASTADGDRAAEKRDSPREDSTPVGASSAPDAESNQWGLVETVLLLLTLLFLLLVAVILLVTFEMI